MSPLSPLTHQDQIRLRDQIERLDREVRQLRQQLAQVPVRFGVGAPGGLLFSVTLTSDGGTNGNAAVTASYTYEVTRGTAVIGTEIAPQMQRPKGPFVKAKRGIAYYGTGGLRLLWCDEVPETASCEALSSNTQPPDTPGTVTPGTPGDTEAPLTWTAVGDTDLDHYNVYRTETAGTGYVRDNVEPITTASYTATGLEPGTTYYFTVTSVDTAGNESGYSDEITMTTTDSTPPAAPTLDDPSSMFGEGDITLYWLPNAEPDIASYKIYRTTTSGSGYALVDTVAHPTVEYTDSPGVTEYWYVITAVDDDDNESDPSTEIHYPGIV